MNVPTKCVLPSVSMMLGLKSCKMVLTIKSKVLTSGSCPIRPQPLATATPDGVKVAAGKQAGLTLSLNVNAVFNFKIATSLLMVFAL